MDPIKHHISVFPPRLRKVLERYPHPENICEIRLRDGSPLSLTDHRENITLDEGGRPCPLSRAVRCRSEELSYVLGAFCKGSVYRYFDRLKDGFAVDDYGWRMGVSTAITERGIFLPKRILGINLRIPRHTPFAAKPLAEKIQREGLFSFLIFSPPGEGKTTVLRSLAALLSQGEKNTPPIRVAVIDERGELFPPQMKIKTGLLDVLPDCEKGEGIAIATRLFSPQVICCDEIGTPREAEAVLASCSGGCYVIATAHASCLEEARHTPYLASLISSGKFRHGVFLKKECGDDFRLSFHWESFL
ncbi:MAG: hypothetical protein E7580_06975 [Ruminococcaceae bacterium]|nr:hypothetical protein [Oscillospiraceae bacterium]